MSWYLSTVEKALDTLVEGCPRLVAEIRQEMPEAFALADDMADPEKMQKITALKEGFLYDDTKGQYLKCSLKTFEDGVKAVREITELAGNTVRLMHKSDRISDLLIKPDRTYNSIRSLAGNLYRTGAEFRTDKIDYWSPVEPILRDFLYNITNFYKTHGSSSGPMIEKAVEDFKLFMVSDSCASIDLVAPLMFEYAKILVTSPAGKDIKEIRHRIGVLAMVINRHQHETLPEDETAEFRKAIETFNSA